ncbi:MAG: hydrogenase maturation protein HypF, partial [Coriobacteriales bacterium]|nr:hydrogenase maturation protein HypF [Coriobacteriales bacterium]
PEQKNCFCLTIGDKAYVSQQRGDMDDKAAMENWDHTRRLYQQLFTTTPRVLVADKHPEYLTSKWANDYARESGLGLYRVQHHHAHIAAVLAEAQAEVVAATPATIDHELKSHPERVVGFAFDGSGYGDDGTIWGGEVLLASLTSFKRLAHLRTVVMPGGSVAIRQPWRMAYAWLYTCGLLDHPGAQFLLEQIDYEAQSQLQVIIDRRLNSPLTSSMGRLFDAVSALIGVCREASYEGEPAIELEAVMQSRPADRQKAAEKQSNPTYHFSYGDGVIDLAPLLAAILDDMATGKPQADIALGFHQAVVSIVVELAEQLSVQTDCYDIALSGGVFMNRYLIEQLPSALRGRGLTVYTNRQLPPNDGCIAYGQAAVATAMGGVSTLATSQSSPSRKG